MATQITEIEDIYLRTQIFLAHVEASLDAKHARVGGDWHHDEVGRDAKTKYALSLKKLDELRTSLSKSTRVDPPDSLETVALGSYALIEGDGFVEKAYLSGLSMMGPYGRTDELDSLILTTGSPLGEKLLGKKQGDSVEVKVGNNTMHYSVRQILDRTQFLEEIVGKTFHFLESEYNIDPNNESSTIEAAKAYCWLQFSRYLGKSHPGLISPEITARMDAKVEDLQEKLRPYHKGLPNYPDMLNFVTEVFK